MALLILPILSKQSLEKTGGSHYVTSKRITNLKRKKKRMIMIIKSNNANNNRINTDTNNTFIIAGDFKKSNH